ncbi:MAG: hypothetical protein M1828_007487 [Chrysothrix sp. TS-e1954]|nr:MAG: hypothetical protein M1828_007487 [Chrysothrix sp. TS-e1954]
MPSDEENRKIAMAAEQDLNTYQSKQGTGTGERVSDSTTDSGINTGATTKFPGSTADYGSAVSGAGNNREIPEHEGGGINPETGKPMKAGDFEGVGGPEDKLAEREMARPGDQDVGGNVRMGGETRRP